MLAPRPSSSRLWAALPWPTRRHQSAWVTPSPLLVHELFSLLFDRPLSFSVCFELGIICLFFKSALVVSSLLFLDNDFESTSLLGLALLLPPYVFVSIMSAPFFPPLFPFLSLGGPLPFSNTQNPHRLVVQCPRSLN